MKLRGFRPLFAALLAWSVIATLPAAAAPGGNHGNPAGTKPEQPKKIHTIFLFDRSVDLDELEVAVESTRAVFVSARHTGPMPGGFEAGRTPLEDALDRYEADYRSMADDDRDPPVIALRLDRPVPTNALGALADSVASRTLVHSDTVIAVTESHGRGRHLHVVKGEGVISHEVLEPNTSPTDAPSSSPEPSIAPGQGDPTQDPSPQASQQPAESTGDDEPSPTPSSSSEAPTDDGAEGSDSGAQDDSGVTEPDVEPTPANLRSRGSRQLRGNGFGTTALTASAAECANAVAANQSNPPNWAPHAGLLKVEQMPNGRRKVSNTLRWDSQSDLDAFCPIPNDPHGSSLENYTYEHDFKLMECGTDQYLTHNAVTFGFDFPEDSGPYLDTSWESGTCEFDLSTGVYSPTLLDADVDYSTVILTDPGELTESAFELRAQRLENDCLADDDPDCIGTGTDPGTRGEHVLIAESETCNVPGTFRWDVSNSGCADSSLQSYRPTVMADDPSGYWRLNEAPSGPSEPQDEAGHNNATYTNPVTKAEPSLLDGESNASVRFNGGYVRAPAPTSAVQGAFSVEAWIHPESTSGGQAILTSRSPGEFGFEFGVSNGKLHGDIGNGGGWLTNSADSTSTISAGNTYHVVYTVTQSQWKLYLNGQLDNSGSISSGALLWDSNHEMGIGKSLRYNGYAFSGWIDEVALYDTTLSSTRVGAHYNAQAGTYRATVMDDSPVRYWRLGELPPVKAKDETGHNDATYGDPLDRQQASLVAGDSDKSVRFTGGHVLSGIPSVQGQFSVETWIRPQSTSGGHTILSTRTPGEYGFDMGVSNGKLHGDIGNGSSWLTNSADSISTISAGNTYHVVYTVTQSQWKLYINGQLDNSGSIAAGALLWDSNHEVGIGKSLRYNGYAFSGRIDEVAIYDHSLTTTRVGAHFDASNGSYRSTVMADTPFSYWRMGESGSSGPVDETRRSTASYSNVTKGEPSLVDGESNTSVLFDGGYLVASPGMSVRGEFSVEAWIRPESVTGSCKAIVSTRSPGEYGFDLCVDNGKLHGDIGTGGGWLTNSANSTSDSIVADHTYHVVYTVTSSTWKVFIDGQLNNSGSIGSNALLVDPNHELAIGKNLRYGNTFPGRIDEVAIYDHALSGTQVGRHYEAGGGPSKPLCISDYAQEVAADNPRAQLCLGEDSGTTAYDETDNHLNGTYKNGPTLGQEGIAGAESTTAVDFDGTNDYVEISDANDPTAYTIEAWVKPDSTADQSIIVRTDGTGPSNARSHQLRISGAKFQHFLYDGSDHVVTGTTTVQTGVWYHVVGTASNNGTMRLFVNSEEEGTPVNIGSLWAGGDRWHIASNSRDGMGYFNGTIDEAAIYDHVLSRARLASHLGVGSTAPFSGPLIEGPSNPSGDASPEWRFESLDSEGIGVSSFECRLSKDGTVVNGWQSCSSPYSQNLTSSGTYGFAVRELKSEGQVSTIATWSHTYEAGVPEAPVITDEPDDPATASSVSYSFSGTGSVTFECQLSSGGNILEAYAPCTSPKSYDISSYPVGRLTFNVRSVGASNQRSAPASSTVRVTAFGPGGEMVPSPFEDEADDIANESEDFLNGRFAGAWQEYDVDEKIILYIGVVEMSSNDEQVIEGYSTSNVSVVSVNQEYSYSELEQFSAGVTPVDSTSSFMTSIDVAENTVRIEVEDQTGLQFGVPPLDLQPGIPLAAVSASWTSNATMPVAESRLTYPAYKAGRGWAKIINDEDGALCTLGFTFVKANGTKVGSTAGHCAKEGRTLWSGPNLRTRVGEISKNFLQSDTNDNIELDISWVKISQENARRSIFINRETTRLVTRVDRDPKEGEKVCVSGVATGIECGTIKRHVMAVQPDDAGWQWVNLWCVSPDLELHGGDSGAPMYRPVDNYFDADADEMVYTGEAIGIAVAGAGGDFGGCFESVDEIPLDVWMSG